MIEAKSKKVKVAVGDVYEHTMLRLVFVVSAVTPREYKKIHRPGWVKCRLESDDRIIWSGSETDFRNEFIFIAGGS